MPLLISISIILIITTLLMKKIQNDDIKNGHYINKEEYTIRNTLLHSLRKKEKREEIEKRNTFKDHSFDRRAYLLVVAAIAISLISVIIFREGDAMFVFITMFGLFSVLSFFMRSNWYLAFQNLTVILSIMTIPCIGSVLLGIGNVVVSIYYIKQYQAFKQKAA